MVLQGMDTHSCCITDSRGKKLVFYLRVVLGNCKESVFPKFFSCENFDHVVSSFRNILNTHSVSLACFVGPPFSLQLGRPIVHLASMKG